FLCSIFLGREAIEGSIYQNIEGFIGADSAKQIQDIIKNASISGKGGIAATIGVITLLIGATTVFAEMQDSINGIWGLKAKPKAGWFKLVRDRLLSFGLIGGLGFLLLVSLGATAVVEAIGNRLEAAFPDVAVAIFYVINLVLNLTVTTILFAVIFKILPDAKIKWKDIWPGAIATSLLFLIGKFAISFYISKSEVGSTYGAAGSLVILLVWIYYSSIILYFGAEFTKAYALRKGSKIIPTEYAVWNNEPVVTGAKPKDEHPSTTLPKEKRSIDPIPSFAFAQHKMNERKEIEKQKKVGAGTVLLGLALYFFTSSREK
ncbi:MAG: YihY/virulence factor BrkB family protein, partial [Flavisolibacter sp.]